MHRPVSDQLSDRPKAGSLQGASDILESFCRSGCLKRRILIPVLFFTNLQEKDRYDAETVSESLCEISCFCKFCTKNCFIFCDVWQHFWNNPCYYNNRKNPPIHYIKFYYPHSKIPSPKEQRSIAVLLLYTKSGAMHMHRPAYSPFSFLFPYFLRIRPGICILHLIAQFKQNFVKCCQSLCL